jgi:hypothetical protein
MLISEFLQILEYSARKSSVHRYLVLNIESADELVTAINMHMIRSMITRIRFENVSPSLLPTHNRRVSAMIRPCKPSKFPRGFGDHCGADLLEGYLYSLERLTQSSKRAGPVGGLSPGVSDWLDGLDFAG